MRLFFFPSCPRGGYVNPYCINYKKSFSKWFAVEELDDPITIMKSLTLFHYAFVSDVFVLNWIENARLWKFGLIQFALVILSLRVIKFRKKRIVWMLHNLNPHEGRTKYSDKIKNYLFKNSTLIVSHSVDAAAYARNRTKKRVEYICHPICLPNYKCLKENVEQSDVLIWGSVLPYKGVAEFLEVAKNAGLNEKIIVLGKCSDPLLERRIQSYVASNVTFVNRFAEYSEIASFVKQARYVLFPYIGDCFSSSGALMDTIAMNGGIPVGPNRGAFKDLAHEGLCITYKSWDELIDIIRKPNQKKDYQEFVDTNSWENFAKKMYSLIND